eukprot:CAMPEP_0173093874 /NCGR_PEP_ID=MMETSP1102-20130122/30445_1 /TAXON_ID=49646 /ORGANISM="Geminigera sp., Strain Caron Lab Isolate" /LENGTH=80 /DNA_ID=CAMNT_0013982363 /DNA_START=106 /DNA_END=348 /DNA_ORIENTATION=+
MVVLMMAVSLMVVITRGCKVVGGGGGGGEVCVVVSGWIGTWRERGGRGEVERVAESVGESEGELAVGIMLVVWVRHGKFA